MEKTTTYRMGRVAYALGVIFGAPPDPVAIAGYGLTAFASAARGVESLSDSANIHGVILAVFLLALALYGVSAAYTGRRTRRSIIVRSATAFVFFVISTVSTMWGLSGTCDYRVGYDIGLIFVYGWLYIRYGLAYDRCAE